MLSTSYPDNQCSHCRKLLPKPRVIKYRFFRLNVRYGDRVNIAIGANDAFKMKGIILSAIIWQPIFEHGLRTFLEFASVPSVKTLLNRLSEKSG